MITRNTLLLLLAAYLVLMNLVAYAMMYLDKEKAKKGAYRISEKALFLSAIFGGSIGAILGMQRFRHKTKHWYFVIGMPLILVLQLVAGILAVFFLK